MGMWCKPSACTMNNVEVRMLHQSCSRCYATTPDLNFRVEGWAAQRARPMHSGAAGTQAACAQALSEPGAQRGELIGFSSLSPSPTHLLPHLLRQVPMDGLRPNAVCGELGGRGKGSWLA